MSESRDDAPHAPPHTPRFGETRWLDFSEALLGRICGWVNLVHLPEERRQIASTALEELYDGPWRERLPELANREVRDAFMSWLTSYHPIEVLLGDASVEDIMINSVDSIFVHRTGVGLCRTDLRFESARELAVFVRKLIVFSGRLELEPINDVELADVRGRVNVVNSPFGPQITITRAKRDALSILRLIDDGELTYELAAQLWMYVEGLGVRPGNVVISGGPGAGKTTLLNALLSFFPPSERVVIIEDTLELNAEMLENCSRLQTDRLMPMTSLVKNSLRMRPDRIVIGEVRGEEAQDLMTAISIGKYCMGTLHASTARETILRLQHWPMNVPEILVNLIDVFVVLRRFRRSGRIVRVVSEVCETAGMEQNVVLLSPVWIYDQRTHEMLEDSASSVFRDRLARAAGLEPLDVMRETARRARVLELMNRRPELQHVADMTRFCQLYISRPDEALAKLGTSLEKLDGEFRA